MNFSSLIKHKSLPHVQQCTKFNGINGSDAESFAAAQLILAMRAEVSWGSREEDGRKIDLIFSFDHPWYKGERILILCQVKSGSKYGESLTKGFKLKKAAYSSAQRTTHSILMVWVDRDLNKPYWAYIHPDSKGTTNGYGAYHNISPATYFDIARCVSNEFKLPKGGKGVIVRKRKTNFQDRRNNVYAVYKAIGATLSPVLGNIEMTRLAWRHMFRKGRSKAHKEASLDIIPYLDKILSQKPSDHAITDVNYYEKSGYKYRQTEHILKFYGTKFCEPDGKDKFVIVVSRILEEVRFPVDWQTTAMLSQKVSRKCVLKTIYHKDWEL